MFRALSWLIVVLSLAWARPAFPDSRREAPAQTAPAQPTRDRSATAGYGTGVIRGRILDAATGRGLPRAEVRAGPNAPQFPDNRIVTTDGDGRYEIKGLPAETYVINVSKAELRASVVGRGARRGAGQAHRARRGSGAREDRRAAVARRRGQRQDRRRVRRSGDRRVRDGDALPVHPGIAAAGPVRPRRRDQRHRRIPGLRPVARPVLHLRHAAKLHRPQLRHRRSIGICADVLSRHGQRRGRAAADARAGPDDVRRST